MCRVSQKIRLPAFGSDRLRIRRRNRDITQHAKCKACRAIPYPEVKCVGCRETLPWFCFNAVRLVRWQRNQEISQKAKCKHCWVDSWNHPLIKCSECKQTLPVDEFDHEKFAEWKKSRTLCAAKCENCDGAMHRKSKSRKCNMPFARGHCWQTKHEIWLQIAMQRLWLPTMFLVSHYSASSQAEPVYVFCV